MRLRKRNNGIYELSFTAANGKRKRVSTGQTDKAAAEKRAQVIFAELGKYVPNTEPPAENVRRLVASVPTADDAPWTLNNALADTYDRIWSNQKSAYSALTRVHKVARLDKGLLGLQPLSAINYDWLISLTDYLAAEGLKPATINRYLALISKALEEAVKRGKLAVKPYLPYRRESKHKLRWLSWAEQDRLLEVTDTLWPKEEAEAVKALIIVLADTGGRLSEVLTAPRLSRGRIRFLDTKGGTDRSVPLTAAAEAALPKIPFWSASKAVTRFTRVRDAAGMPDVSLHTLRHTCASRLVQGGMDLYRVKDWLGHSSIVVTQRYAHLAPNSLNEGTAILSRNQEA